MKFYPEGINNKLVASFKSIEEIKAAIDSESIYEGCVMLCDREHNLHIDLGCIEGVIPKNEGALGILEGTVRDIALISRVGKRVCFRVMGFHRDENGKRVAILSRRAVQLKCVEEYINNIRPGEIVDARVTRLEGFGVFIDLACGINSLIPIDMLSVSRISHPRERLREGEMIKCALRKRENDKLTFTLKELLGTWEENAASFFVGETVTGIVRSVESYGVFVELTPNLAGLAELGADVSAGQRVSVFIKSVIPERMKIKLVIVDTCAPTARKELDYFVSSGVISRWRYSPSSADRVVETVF
ncbi:MAG: S1 RNA-binding domain-containing protein [Eubacterium sp.]|nr:S1 RNA-binding domain-containing protein [Eubacterium sp.]